MTPAPVEVGVWAGEWNGEKDIPSSSLVLDLPYRSGPCSGASAQIRVSSPDQLWEILLALSHNRAAALEQYFGITEYVPSNSITSISLSDLEIDL